MKLFIKISFSLTTIILILFISSCKKQPGTGGVAQITGQVYADTIFDNKTKLYLGSGYIASTTVYLLKYQAY